MDRSPNSCSGSGDAATGYSHAQTQSFDTDYKSISSSTRTIAESVGKESAWTRMGHDRDIRRHTKLVPDIAAELERSSASQTFDF